MQKPNERRWGDLAGLLWLAASVALAASLFSYSSQDPSLNALTLQNHPQNLCGYIGSFLSDILYQCFGVTAWVFVAGGLRLAVLYFSGRRAREVQKRLWVDALIVLAVAGLLSLHLGDVRLFGGQVRIGGWFGYMIVRQLVPALNQVGLDIVLIGALAALLVLWSERGILEITRWPKDLGISALADFGVAWKRLAAAFRKFRDRQPPAPPIVRTEPTLPKSFLPLGSEKPQEEDRTPITSFFLEENRSTDTRTAMRMAGKIQRRVENWELPKLSLLKDPPIMKGRLDEREIKGKARLLVEKLAQFSVRGDVVGIKPGPAVTMFEFKPAADVKISKITDLADDLSLALSSESVRIIAPIPGRDVVGIETSNSQRESVNLKDVLSDESFWNDDCKLPLTLGRKADGEPRVVDLRKMPHLLVAGTTGSGKSVFVVSMLAGLLFRHSPRTLRLILVDPKQVDLAAFSNLPHLIMPPIREPKKAVSALRWAIREMEKRYRSMSRFGARGIEAFNEMAGALGKTALEEHSGFQQTLDSPYHPDSYYYQPLPYIVVIVEEFGDLMAVDKVNVEQAVVRLAQMARACGIHLVLAMQSPRRDVITGLIKTNIPGRISFKVASKMDSRIILDEGGAERLLARGDMLFLAPGVAKPERHHGPFLSEEEIAAIVQSWKDQGEPEYDDAAMRAIEGSGGGYEPESAPLGDSFDDGINFDDDIRDERYDEILAYVASQKEVSASLLQRRFRLGYPRAARMIEIFETEGVIGPANGSKPRQVLVKDHSKL